MDVVRWFQFLVNLIILDLTGKQHRVLSACQVRMFTMTGIEQFSIYENSTMLTMVYIEHSKYNDGLLAVLACMFWSQFIIILIDFRLHE
jgi:hypothetical protein